MELLYFEEKYPIICLRQRTFTRGYELVYYNIEHEWIQIIKYYDNKEVSNGVREVTDRDKKIIGKLYHEYVANKIKQEEKSNGKTKD